MLKHHNQEYYDAGLTNEIPKRVADRHYAQDRVRDFWYHMSVSGQVLKDLHGISGKIIVSGGLVVQNGANAIDISALVGYAPYEVDVMDDFSATPPTVKQEDVNFIRIASSALIALDLSALSIPPTWGSVNYLKIKYSEVDGASRARAKVSGSYVYEKEPSYEITCDTVAPTAYEIVLADLTSADSGTTIVVSYASRTICPPFAFEASLAIESKNMHATYSYNASGELTQILKKSVNSGGSTHVTEKAHYIRNEVTGMTWTPGTLRLSKGSAFTAYTHVAGDRIRISAGTGVTLGTYIISSKVDNDTIELSSSISAGTPSDVDCTGDGDIGAIEKIIDGKTYLETIVYDSSDRISTILRTQI